MAIKVQDITARVQAALRDASQDNWPEDVIHEAIFEGEKVIVNYRPDANPVDSVLTCVVGIKQTLVGLTPAPNRLLSVKYNRAGDVDGRSVRRISMGDLDAIRPNWRSASGVTAIREFMHDDREPLIFYVNPPAASGAKVQIAYSAIPTAYGVVGVNTVVTVSDLYEPMLVEWALFRLFGHDIEGSVNLARSNQHLQIFERMMGIKVQADLLNSPSNQENRK